MAAEYFNSLGGFSVNIPEIPVIDANGNVITNVNTTGNVSANVVYATYYRWANGQPFNATAGGNNTQLQFNNNGSFAGVPNVTYDGSFLNLGNISALKIGGGLNGYFLQTDGEGNLSWAEGGGGNGIPGGTNTTVQFNDSGNFGGSNNFTFNSTTGLLNVPNINVTGNTNLGSVDNLTITGGSANYVLSTDGAGNLSWVAQTGGGSDYSNANVAAFLPTYTGNVGANWVIADYFLGNGHNLTFLPGANVQGTVANAAYTQ